MRIALFLVLFVVFILLVTSRLARMRRTVELGGLDGSVLGFSEDGVSWFRDGKYRFFRSSEIKRFSVEKLGGDVYELKMDNGREIITVPVKEEELRKLFTKVSGGYAPVFPWLETVFGVLTGFLVANLIADNVHNAFLREQQPSEISKDDSVNSFTDYSSDFDCGDFFDGEL
jgi:hypothetical protein